MKSVKSNIAAIALTIISSTAFAGNEDRAGSAGAQELLINPWAMSSGMAGANSASVRGLESVMLNVAGLASVEKTEIMFSYNDYMSGSGIDINTIGLAQQVGESGVMALTAMVMSFGEMDVTTAEIPEGGIGTFSPVFVNITASYAKKFSENISGGMSVRIVSQTVSNASASGVGIDAGVKYETGPKKNIKFAITLRNVGPPMQFGGDGLTFSGVIPSNNEPLAFSQRSASFEMPATLSIGVGYDFYFDDEDNHILSLNGTFQANSFTRDQYMIGAEYAFRKKLMLRAGYLYEDQIGNVTETATAFTGLAAGATIALPNKTGKSEVSFSYAYRNTRTFSGIHTLGLRLNLK